MARKKTAKKTTKRTRRSRKPRIENASEVKDGRIYCVNHKENTSIYWGGNSCDNSIEDDGSLGRYVCGTCVAKAAGPPDVKSYRVATSDPDQPKRRPGRPRKHPKKEVPVDENGNPIKRGRGRPKGSKNKATIERERAIAAGEIEPPKPKKRGRPKGSKDSKPRKRRSAKK